MAATYTAPEADFSQQYGWGTLTDQPSQTIGCADPAWFVDAAWQIGEREADSDIATGNVTQYGSGADFLGSL